MFGEMRPRPPITEISREQKEKKERVTAMIGSILKWTDALTRMHQEKPRGTFSLPLSRERGAAFLPAFLFTAALGATGCGWQTRDCGPQEEEFIKASMTWMAQHPKEIQEQMNLLWPNTRVTAEDLINTMMTVPVVCGSQTNEKELKKNEDALGAAFRRKDFVIVDISEEEFRASLRTYEETKWVKDSSLSDLAEIVQTEQDVEMADEIHGYFTSLSWNTLVLGHELAHIVYNRGHEPGEQEQRNDIFYTWGFAANDACHEYAYDITNPIYDTILPETWDEHIEEESGN